MTSNEYLETNEFSHESEVYIRERTEKLVRLETQELHFKKQLEFWDSQRRENQLHLNELIQNNKTKTQDYHIIKSRLGKSEKATNIARNNLQSIQTQIQQLNRF